ncbi:patatin-like phospholipase family protein [Actinosynnema sp. NPDC050436]|uniref:patatin-like phospholipase family protein n=1 Tax=Actinosynnema sp. NPDC050436 TaxID=3155659 RepID=UPI0033E24B4B
MIALPEPVGFVPGGGGSLGAGQVGMLRAPAGHGVAPDLVVGTSVGSVNGALLALDPAHAFTRLGRVWERMTRSRVFPGGLLTQARTLRQHRTHLFPNTGPAEVVAFGLDGAADFADLALPFGAVEVEPVAGAAVTLTSGDLVSAVPASAAIPGVHPPVHRDGLVHYDGSVPANVPIRQAPAMGAKSLVLLDCAFPGHLPAVPAAIAEALLFRATPGMRNQAVLEVEPASASVPVLYLPGPPVQPVTPLDSHHIAELVASSYEASARFLDALRVTGPGLYGHPSGLR